MRGPAIMVGMTPSVHEYNEVDDLLAGAGEFLAAREAEHNLMLGICSNIRASPERFAEDPPTFATVMDPAARRRTASASVRSIPRPSTAPVAMRAR